jgi:hypothetical protein
LFFQRGFEKSKNKFNLQDDDDEEEEQLTHYGQSLSEIEKFDAPRNDSDDDEDTGAIGGRKFFKLVYILVCTMRPTKLDSPWYKG